MMLLIYIIILILVLIKTINVYRNEELVFKFYIIIPKKHPELDYVSTGQLKKRYFKTYDGDKLSLDMFEIIPLEYCELIVLRKDLTHEVIKDYAITLYDELKGD